MKTREQLEQEHVQRVKVLKGSLAYERKKAGLTQAQVGQEIGVAARTVGGWELGNGSIGFEEAWQIADLYGISLDQLAGRPFVAAQES